jgi:hypothetical protein
MRAGTDGLSCDADCSVSYAGGCKVGPPDGISTLLAVTVRADCQQSTPRLACLAACASQDARPCSSQTLEARCTRTPDQSAAGGNHLSRNSWLLGAACVACAQRAAVAYD